MKYIAVLDSEDELTEEVIDALKDTAFLGDNPHYAFEMLSIEKQERKVGYWIPVYQGDEIIDYRCSSCEYGSTFGKGIHGMNYCNNCGSYNQGKTLDDLLRGNEND